MMRALPEEEKAKINQEVRLFRIEKEELDREISKWDDSGNDIVVLAKRMCMIMMEMTDFTRGRGPLKNTMDVINAACALQDRVAARRASGADTAATGDTGRQSQTQFSLQPVTRKSTASICNVRVASA